MIIELCPHGHFKENCKLCNKMENKEIKTLKDINLEKIIPFYLSETNNIENWNKWSFEHLALNIRNELKAEAIREIKYAKSMDGTKGLFGGGIDFMFTKGVVEYIKWKFNIAEEDLK